MKSESVLQKVSFYLILGTVFLLPLFYLPITADFYDFNKNALLFIVSLIATFLLTLSFVMERQVKLIRSPLGLPLLAVLASWLLSTILRSPNRVDAMMMPGQTGTILALTLFFVAAINFIRTRREMELTAYALIASISTLGLVTVVWTTGILSSLLTGQFQSVLWTPTGSPMATIILLVSSLPFVVTLLAREKKFNLSSALLTGSLILTIAGSGLMSYRLLQPANRPLTLPQQSAWAIALESVKVSPLFGTGPSTFLYNFTQFRPVEFNLTSNWAFRFSNSSNYYLQLLSTLGFVGLASYLFLIARSYMILAKTARAAHTPESPMARVLSLSAAASATMIFVTQLFVPANVATQAVSIVCLVIAVVALKQAGSSLVSEANIDIVAGTSAGHQSPLLPWIMVVLLSVLAIPSIYLASRAYAGEVMFQDALLAAEANDGKKTYDTLITAMSTNPYKDSYRVVYSQTNLLLANAIAEGENITEADRSTVTQLIQQSIREAKNAVALNPRSVANVENLASVYRNLLNLAEGADAWTVASYRQAILLDPVNPNLRIAMGGVLYSLNQYDEAIGFFQQAVDLKPDLANAHYNLAATYRAKEDYERAFNSMSNVVQLVDKSSADYATAVKELDELRAQLGAAAPAPTDTEAPVTLTTPAPIPSPIVNPQIQLPESLAPEAPAPVETVQ